MSKTRWMALLALPLLAAAVQAAPARGKSGGMEKAAFLGVVTAPMPPVLASQLSLPRGVGLTVEEVDPDSPAARILKNHDVLHKLNDQLLVSPEQLAILVRSMKAGDEVKVTFVRGGKSQTESVKLGERELPPLEATAPPLPPGFGGMPGMMDPDAVQDQMRRMMERWQGRMQNPPDDDDWVPMTPRGRPGNRVAPQPDPDVKVEKHSSFSTSQTTKQGDLTVTLSNNNGDKRLLAKKDNGDVVFDGPINTDKEIDKVPPELKKTVKEWQDSVKITVTPHGTRVESKARSRAGNPDDVL